MQAANPPPSSTANTNSAINKNPSESSKRPSSKTTAPTTSSTRDRIKKSLRSLSHAELNIIHRRISPPPQTITIPYFDPATHDDSQCGTTKDGYDATTPTTVGTANSENTQSPADTPVRSNQHVPNRGLQRTPSLETFTTELLEEDEEVLHHMAQILRSAQGERRDSFLTKVQVQIYDVLGQDGLTSEPTRSWSSSKVTGSEANLAKSTGAAVTTNNSAGHSRSLSVQQQQKEHTSNREHGIMEKTQLELVQMLEEMRMCLKSTQEDLIEERLKRKSRDSSMYKLARELGKNKRIIQAHEKTIDKLRGDLASSSEQEALLRKEVEALRRTNQVIRQEIKAEYDKELYKIQGLYRTAIEDHQRIVSDMSRAHSKQREQLNLEVSQTSEELHVMRREMGFFHHPSTNQHKKKARWRLFKRKTKRRIVGVCAILVLGTLIYIAWSWGTSAARRSAAGHVGHPRIFLEGRVSTVHINNFDDEIVNSDAFESYDVEDVDDDIDFPDEGTVVPAVATTPSIAVRVDDSPDDTLLSSSGPSSATARLSKLISTAKQDQHASIQILDKRRRQDLRKGRLRTIGVQVRRVFARLLGRLLRNQERDQHALNVAR